MPQLNDQMPVYPDKFWIEELTRGTQEHILISHGRQALGTILVRSYEEKVAWMKAVEHLNLILEKSPEG